MANKGFFCLDGYLKRTAKLSDQELGRLFRACMIYHATGEVTELTGRESVAFDFIREDIDAANEAYAVKCEINRRNRIGTIDNDRQRSITIVNEDERSPTKGNESHKEKENIKGNVKGNNKDSLPAGYDRFWEAYPKKTAKPDAVKAFGKLKPDAELLEVMLGAIERQKATAQWQEDNGRFIPHPATWLNGRRWEDEVRSGGMPARTVTAQDYEQRDYEDTEEKPEDMIRRLMSEGA